MVHFATGSAHLLGALAGAGGDVIGVDWRVPLDAAWATVHDAVGLRAIQGNLDPAALLGGWPQTRGAAEQVLAFAAARPGHIFNLGHAAPRDVEPSVLRDLAAFVHDSTARGSSAVTPIHATPEVAARA
jgi:uroporphyrinogen decarboxylase